MKNVIKILSFIIFLSLFLSFLYTLKSKVMAQIDPDECRKPTSYTDPDGDATNPSNAYDGSCGDESTYADEAVNQNLADEIVFHTWQTTSYTYTSLTLYVKYTTSGFSDDLWSIKYSTDGGSSWNDLVAANSNNYASIQTASISLSASQDLSQLQVKVYGDKVKGPDGGHINIYDIYTLGTYEADTTPPTFSKDEDDSGGSIIEGGIINVSTLWNDDSGLSKGVLRTNKTGTWQNETWYSFSSKPEWFNTTIDTSGYAGKTICWVQWANDTNNNWNTSMQIHCFEVITLQRWLEIDWTGYSDINSSYCTESSPCQITRYNTFNASANITCRTNPPGYSCGEVYGSIRYNASTGVVETTTYNFSGISSPSYTTNATEFSYSSKDVPLWHGNELDTTCYNAISESDDSWCSQSPDLNNLYQFFQFHFKINENPNEITKIDYYWEGYADAAPTELYIYNFSSNSWEYLDYGSSSVTDNIVSGSLTSNLQNYISKSYIHLMSITGVLTDINEYLHNDYVYINITTGGEEMKLINTSEDTPFYILGGAENPSSCGSLSSDDSCILNWTINATGSANSVWAIDVNFSASDYNLENDTNNSIIQIVVTAADASFAIAMPSSYSTWVDITGLEEASATSTNWISFNFTDIPQTDVQPYELGNSNYNQDGSTKPIYYIDDTGNVAINISLRVNETIQGITIYANCTCTDCISCQTTKLALTTSYQTIVNQLSTTGYANITLWADLAQGTPPPNHGITIYIKSQG